MPLLPLLDEFILDCKKGRHLQKNGKPIGAASIKKYEFLRLYLILSVENKNFELKIIPAQKLTSRELLQQKNYWKKLYTLFTDYLYEKRNCYDNFVGRMVKSMRTFLNYLHDERNIQTSPYKRFFYARSEEIPIVVISPERLHFLIYNKVFEESLPDRLKRIKDIMVVGCTVALRYSDLMKLTLMNLEQINGSVYLNVKSQKTGTYTKVKIPDYVYQIFIKYSSHHKYLLPSISKTNLNKYMKELACKANWTEPHIKTRERRGLPVVVYADEKNKSHYRFCDIISSHTMRRTAITTMLMLGMNELMVRNISGHAANSKEFFKYVSLVQHYLDEEIDRFHDQLRTIATEKSL